MKRLFLACLAGLGFAAASQAAEFTINNPVATAGPGSVFYSIDLTTTGLSQIAWIEIEDPGTNSSSREVSGFDLDAFYIDVDGIVGTTGDKILPSSYDVILGTASNGASSATLQNTNSDGTVNFGLATLDVFDGDAGARTGFFSMGDNGIARANFTPVVPVPAIGTLFVFAGELGDAEVLSRITISDTPSEVSLPAGAMLLLTGLGVLGLRRKMQG